MSIHFRRKLQQTSRRKLTTYRQGPPTSRKTMALRARGPAAPAKKINSLRHSRGANYKYK